VTSTPYLPVVATKKGARPPIDLTGQRIGRLLVLGLVARTSGPRAHLVWRCVCDCGKTTDKRATNLQSGHTKSCGCNIGGPLAHGESCFNKLFGRYQRVAGHRSLAFELTKEQFAALTKSDCFYCGQPPSQRTRDPHSNGDYVYSGVDRLDNAVGYTPDNSVSCCRVCNDMKGTLNRDEFVSQVQRVAAFMKGR
jgi:hypothetical protein